MLDIIVKIHLFSSKKKIYKDFGKRLGKSNSKLLFKKNHLLFFSSEFFGVDPSFPSDQLMTRIASDSGRNIYFVSDSLKQIVTLNQDRIKVYILLISLLLRIFLFLVY